MEVLTTSEMERADQLTIAAGTPGFALVMSAGEAGAEAAMDLAEEGPIVVVAGRGNNGGGGFLAAGGAAPRGPRGSPVAGGEGATPPWPASGRPRRAAGNSRCCRSTRRRSASRR